MNGYTATAESYRKLMEEGLIDRETAEREIRVYDFLGTCDMDDFCLMVDSTAFNDIIGAFLKMALKNADISDKSRQKVFSELFYIFDVNTAKEVLQQSLS